MNATDDTLVDHQALMTKLIEHEDKFVKIGSDLHGINEKLDPISQGIDSIAFAFKSLLWLGAGSAAVVGIIELVDHMP